MSVSTAISCVRNLLFILFEFISVHAYWYITLFLYCMMHGSLRSYTTDSSSGGELLPVLFLWDSGCSIFSCLYCVMLTIVHSVVLFLLVTVMSVFLRINYHFGIFKLSLAMFQFKLWSMYLSNKKRLIQRTKQFWPWQHKILIWPWCTNELILVSASNICARSNIESSFASNSWCK